MSDFSPLSISALLRQYRSGEWTPEDTVRKVYERIRSAGDDHVWIHLVPEADSLQRARELSSLSRDLPLYGVPFAIKDNFDVAGMPTTAGCPAYAYIPAATATAVSNALAGGAILIGKTNMDQFATGLVGTRSPYGACSCVFHSEYISGGSSSGSAVAVAKGEVAFSFGTDTAGSGRVPAALNGIVGIKPSRGLVSAAGVVPACRSLDCVSIFAADVASGGVVLNVISGADRADPYSRTFAQSPSHGSRPKIAVPSRREMQFFDDSHSSDCWAQSLQKLQSLGAELLEIDLEPFLKAAELLYFGPYVAERYAAVGDFVQAAREQDLDPTVRKIILDSARYSAVDVFRAEYQLQELKKASAAVFQSIDALFLPTTPTTYKISEVQANPLQLNSRLGLYTNFVNLLDLCGIAVPGPMRHDDLPFGVTFLAPAFSDRKLLNLAHWWEGTQGREYLPSLHPGVLIAVVGAHLTGQPLNWQLTSRGGELVSTTKTTPQYRLFALRGTTPPKPGLVRVTEHQDGGIEVEVWRLSAPAFGSFVAEIPPPLSIGTLELADGSLVKGFLCEPCALDNAEEITHLGSWRRYLAQSASTPVHAGRT